MQFMVMSFSDKDNFAKLWNFQNLTYGGRCMGQLPQK